jgi:peptidoglycan hydrolase-like protein with peptidoglycan-binding domain
VQRAAPRDAIGDLIRNGEPAAAPARPTPAQAAPAQRPAARDDIGELIRMCGVPVPPANVGRTDAPERIAAAQRALNKLGYGPLKADGSMGPGTRQAIERFERDRRLAVTGEVGSRTARELASQSGLPVD